MAHCVRFQDDGKIARGSKISLNGVPFFVVGSKMLKCHQGPSHCNKIVILAKLALHNRNMSNFTAFTCCNLYAFYLLYICIASFIVCLYFKIIYKISFYFWYDHLASLEL